MQVKLNNINIRMKTNVLMVAVAAVAAISLTLTTITPSVYAQNQAPNSDKSQGQGQGPPFNHGICIVTGNLNPTVEPKSEQAKQVCKGPGQVSNSGQCMQIIKENPGIFGSAIDSPEECKAAFPYTAPNSNNPND